MWKIVFEKAKVRDRTLNRVLFMHKTPVPEFLFGALL